MYNLILWTFKKNIDPDTNLHFKHESTLENGMQKRNSFRQNSQHMSKAAPTQHKLSYESQPQTHGIIKYLYDSCRPLYYEIESGFFDPFLQLGDLHYLDKNDNSIYIYIYITAKSIYFPSKVFYLC